MFHIRKFIVVASECVLAVNYTFIIGGGFEGFGFADRIKQPCAGSILAGLQGPQLCVTLKQLLDPLARELYRDLQVIGSFLHAEDTASAEAFVEH